MSTVSDGIYTYKFSGFSQDAALLGNFLVGLGWLEVTKGQVNGHHHSTHVRMSGGAEPPKHWQFAVTGSFSPGTTGQIGSASLKFVQEGVAADDAQILRSDFAFVRAAALDRYWLISKADAEVQTGGSTRETAMEVVEGELVRIS
ncbi:hypothetical protein [Sphingomonas kyeonggiensis]|uniref:Uncharacterized protein n=1 Tax=Sphingomonas kyeonggiensis TaxID=1268553 RepID=A0A7W6NY64_9SPHN|nr:hypothetical protein [Sphingomonas kyeonggiensis]MBB4100058.1 hypothetical protein [Sphingomonas kyeonggiensis]